MRREFLLSFGRVTGTKSAVLRKAYRRLTGDKSAADNAATEALDHRIQEVLDLQDPDLIWDLRINNKGRPEEYCHYASALFLYEKSFALKHRSYVGFICMDEKHTCKVGEPGFPVVAVERGKEVIVGKNIAFKVADHDFTKISITPSVTFSLNHPDSLEGSFYRGQVYICIKENCFEPPSTLRHMTELCGISDGEDQHREILCLYTDGGPDHRVSYLSVQLASICLFLKTDKDMVVAVQTPPYNSWKDPAERIMSILNNGLQSVGLMRASIEDVDI